MTAGDLVAGKRMRLRYAGVCRACSRALAAGEFAIYFRADKHVECVRCVEGRTAPSTTSPQREPATAVQPVAGGAGEDQPPSPAECEAAEPWSARSVSEATLVVRSAAEVAAVEVGVAGASARREFERRAAKRQDRVRAKHPRIGGFLLAVSDDPQSTRAWAVGAVGEEVLAKSLDALTNRGVRVLHDRRIPRTKANIDHIAIGPSGVFVIDAKRYRGRPSLRLQGGVLRPRTETLLVGTRDCSKLVAGVTHQVDLVRAAIAGGGELSAIPVRGMLCFVDADWPLFGGGFTTADIAVLWPKRACERICEGTALSHEQVDSLHRLLAGEFPIA